MRMVRFRALSMTLLAPGAFGVLLASSGCARVSRGGAYIGVASTPPMGWNSWNFFADKVDDQIVRETADAMASSGMRARGYTYVNIDDTWQGERDSQGVLHSNARFPDMKALADYVHSKGLKIGIYSSPGPRTCAGYAGSYEHEEQDAKVFAEWGIDYLKYDWCSAATVYTNDQLRSVYQKMGDALRATNSQYGVTGADALIVG